MPEERVCKNGDRYIIKTLADMSLFIPMRDIGSVKGLSYGHVFAAYLAWHFAIRDGTIATCAIRLDGTESPTRGGGS